MVKAGHLQGIQSCYFLLAHLVIMRNMQGFQRKIKTNYLTFQEVYVNLRVCDLFWRDALKLDAFVMQIILI